MDFSNVIEIYNEAVRILNANEKIREQYSPDIMALERRRDISSTDTYRIGVIGVTSSGKSTLINSLMGESILPSRACPSSSQLVRCHYSKEKKAVVYFEDGTNLVLSGNDCNQETISLFADEGFNSNNKEQVKELELCSPKFPLGKDVILVDSPGLDAFGYEGHEKLTMASLLPTVDLCILVTTCKTNSDLKLQSVLNTIAENSAANMPVILVQNMIDSIMPSADGLKSTNDVAKDHRHRLQRVIDSSNVKDKKSVKIIQYSAQWALQGRIANNASSQNLLFKSNYQKLVDAVNQTVSNIRPAVKRSRLLRAKKEIDRLAEDSKHAAGGNNCVLSQESFKYENYDDEIDQLIEDINSNIEILISQTEVLRDKYIGLSRYTESVVSNVRNEISALEDQLISEMRTAESVFSDICEELNVEKRDLTVSVSLSGISAPHLCQKTVSERVKEKGIKGFFKRLNPFGDSGSGYKIVTHTYTDDAATESLIIDYINSTKRVFKDTAGKFKKRMKDIRNCFVNEVEMRRKSFEARQTKFLEAQQYLDISRALTKLSFSIIIDSNCYASTNSTYVERPEDTLSEVECPLMSYSLLNLAEKIKRNIHVQTIENLIHCSKHSVSVLGWDKNSETECLDKFFDCKISTDLVHRGYNQINERVSLFHIDGTTSDLRLGKVDITLVLVNATQIGSAEKQIYPLIKSEMIPDDVKVIFVIQDFAEIIATKDIGGSLTELKEFINEDLNRKDIGILLVHNNPIYNLAIAAIQESGISLQSDSINIANDLKSRFGYLYEDESYDVIHDMLKAFES